MMELQPKHCGKENQILAVRIGEQEDLRIFYHHHKNMLSTLVRKESDRIQPNLSSGEKVIECG